MKKPFRHINDLVFCFGTEKEKIKKTKPMTGVEKGDTLPADQLPIEYRIKSVRVIEPVHGFRINKPFSIEGEIEPLVDKIMQPRILLYPTGCYNGQEDHFVPGGIAVFADKTNGFCGVCNHLFTPAAYEQDRKKTTDAVWYLTVTAQGRTAEKAVHSDPLPFPQQEKPFVYLRNGHYDDNGVLHYAKPACGEDYIPGKAVTELQHRLTALKFLHRSECKGYFTRTTEDALREFQRYARDSLRMPLKLGKCIEIKKKLQQLFSDGIVCPATQDELDLWKRNEWIKPQVILRLGDFDDEGVDCGHGKRDEEDYHCITLVKEMQQNLKERGSESITAVDGWFGEKTREAIIDFQTCAAEKKRIVSGAARDVAVTFTGAINGVFDEPTQKELQTWIHNNYSLPQISDTASLFYAPGMYKGKGGWYIAEEEDIHQLIEEITYTESLRADIDNFRTACTRKAVNEITVKNAQRLERNIIETFKGLSQQPEDTFQELLAVKVTALWSEQNHSQRVYIRPQQVKNGTIRGCFRKNNNRYVKKLLDQWVKSENHLDSIAQKMDDTLRAVLHESSIVKNRQLQHAAKNDHTKDKTAAGCFSSTYEAQFVRFVAGEHAVSAFDFRDKKINVTASGSAVFSLASGSISGLWNLPDDNGFDIYTCLKLSSSAQMTLGRHRIHTPDPTDGSAYATTSRNNNACRLRFAVDVCGKIFSHTALTASALLPCIRLQSNGASKNDGTLHNTITVTVQWCSQEVGEFEDLALLVAVPKQQSNVADDRMFHIRFEKGKLRCESGCMATMGFIGNTGYAFEMDCHKGIEFLGSLYKKVGFHRIDSVECSAFELYLHGCFAQFVVNESISCADINSVGHFNQWIMGRKREDEKLRKTKEMIRNNLNDQKKLQQSPPEALGQLLQVIADTPEKEDLDTVLALIRSAQNHNHTDSAHRMKWIVRSFYDPELSRNLRSKDSATQKRMKRIALKRGIEELTALGSCCESDMESYKRKLSALFTNNNMEHRHDNGQ